MTGIKKKCLFCYLELHDTNYEYHEKCSKTLFGTISPPLLDYTLDDITKLAKENVNKRLSITGVQPKLSIGINKENHQNRITIVGLWGEYILKPPFVLYPEMPEIEDMTMHLAAIAKIKNVEHGLIRFRSGELAYITKRFDRHKKSKIAVEDFAQLTETMTENKYIGSVEKIGRTIHKFSDVPGLDVITLFEITLFCFLTGNSDMHLKNFSLITDEPGEIRLSPGYDLIASKLLIPADKDDSALTINGKQRNLRKSDFNILAQNLRINEKAIQKIYSQCTNYIPDIINFTDKGFLYPTTAEKFKKLIIERAERLEL